MPSARRPARLAAAVLAALSLTGCVFSFGGDEETDTARSDDINCATADVDGPCDYGDDPQLDQLWDDCAAGDGEACDDLYYESPFGSAYEAYGNTCGDRGFEFSCADAYGSTASE